MFLQAGIVAAFAMAASGVPLVASTQASAASAEVHAVEITSAPSQATEGDRITIKAKVASPRKADRVQLQERQVDIYGNASWVTVRSRSVRGTARHTFTVVADGINREHYRARATYRQGKAAVSKRKGVTVWRWISLTNYRPYYSTYGISATPYSNFAMNGRQYIGWYTYSSYRAWEARYTPGRNCKAFRGELGVRDESNDGSRAIITLLTEEDQVLFESPVLTPGAVTKVSVSMARPYRFTVRAADVSSEGVHALPAIGDPFFLCTGI
ncbi:MAG TPA: hypothetical protein VFV66_08715 [Nonomuraea sp.]|nr:hypothetical protein [Nonomuraea sp.]